MKTKALCFILLSLPGMFCVETSAQDLQGRWGMGLGFGAQQFYPEGMDKNLERGYGVDGLLSYRFFNRFGLTFAAGYNPLLFALDRGTAVSRDYRTHLFFGDLKMDFDLLRGFFRPYVTAGGGVLNFVVTGDSLNATRFKGNTFIGGGGGVRFLIRRKMIFDLGVNYKQTGADLAGGLRSGTHDSFFAWRSGLTLLFGKSGAGALAKAPTITAPVDSPVVPTPIARVDSLASVPLASPPARVSRKEAADDSAAAKNGIVHYQPLNETEINAAIQKSLQLDDCIRIALSKNFALRQAEHELDKAEALQAGSYGKFLPVLSVQGAQEYTQEKRPFDPSDVTAPQNLQFSNQALIGKVVQLLPTGATLQLSSDVRRDINSPDRFGAPPTRTFNRALSFSVTQPLLRDAWPAIARSPITQAQYQRQMQEKLLFNTKLQTVYAVKKAYYNVLLQRELIKINEAAIRRDSTLVAASESMVTAKLATRRDVLSAEIRLSDDRAALIRTQTDYQLALDLLKEVTGLPLETPIALMETALRYDDVELNEEALIRSAWQNNPALHSASTVISLSREQLRLTKNSLLPRLDLIGSFSGSLDKDTDQNKNLQNYGGQVMLSLSYNLLSRDAAAKAEQAQITLAQQEDRLVDQQRQIMLNLRSIVRNVYSTREELNALQRFIDVAEQKVEFASAMFNLGRASNLDIIDAQEALLKAQNQYLRKLVDYYTQLALLESLTGQSIR